MEEDSAGVEEEGVAAGVEVVVPAAEVVAEVVPAAEVVSVVDVVGAAVVVLAPTAGTEIGWPAAEHWETTTLETAFFSTCQQTGLYTV